MGKILSIINIAFFIELLFVILIAIGILPRESALFLAIFLPTILIISSLEDSVMFTARSIPLFLALPITESFDNFNIWRILVLILFVKFISEARVISFAMFSKGIARASLKQFRLEILISLLTFIAILSLLKAEDPIAGIKRIIYFLNLGMLFFVVRHVINRENFMRLGRNFIFSGIFIASIGVLQLILAYLMPINNFIEFWALTIEKNLYGNAWANIAISANTWFAYFNGTIHLRMFSSFPDSHSFPLYLLIVSVFVSTFIVFRKTVSQSCLPAYFLLGIFSLGIVLSGTRGIWAATALPILIIGFYYFKKIAPKEIILKLTLPLIFFIVALIISQPIFNSKQFQLIENETEESRVLINRLASIFDAGETSNQGRIWIWKESAKSIIKNPALGVGIGNFPAVLKQNIALAKAGSSAHNLFLQILAEIGIFAFAVFLAIIYEIYKKIKNLSQDENVLIKFFGLFSILYIAWIIAYSMTDPAIFDERVFLGLMILVGAIYGISRERKI